MFEQEFRSQANEWKGLSSEKFAHPERTHYESKDMMKAIEGVDVPYRGIKCFNPTYGAATKDKLCLRPFPDLQNRESTVTDQLIKTRQEFVPTSKKYGHREKLHLSQDGSKEAVYASTIKTFYPLANDNKEANLEKTMGRKRVIDSLEDQRNLITIKSLGDKSYKNPEYATKFYHEGGLVVGSSIQARETKKTPVKPSAQAETKSKGMTWKERVKRDEKAEEEEAVKSLFEWEQTTLKEGNPKWRDPDAVEPDLPKKQEVKVDPKNAKKPPAKK